MMFLSELMPGKSCRDLCLNELYSPWTRRHFLVCPLSLSHFSLRNSTFRRHPHKFPPFFFSFVRELGILFLVPPTPSLVQSVLSYAVTTGNCRPCICDKLKQTFFFLIFFRRKCSFTSIAMNAAVVPKFEAWLKKKTGFRCMCHQDCARMWVNTFFLSLSS